ncbi:MAG: translation elongation factor Ts [Buchnera aphidicola (Brevicoryne brassicae)]|uniref:Elongation factor Ts n=1 Tax=Buchnera aphidicola (Brevicoryne brassicae) TaxID=911343 RepID=A0AAJ5PVQ2_9GAMM|nr:translation elongation factor Ts [Buchnera aphidicola]QCI19802.1 elongation factor Ts [Buchnera aphidicola (Brevicoryne brassicae)]WAI19177.1 MAG: translation elongation factor Ts [Buchnera aphidicola (Brevicoryne brassicae)]
MKINVTASLIKKLRSRTGAGFLECKRALLESKGDIELSIDNLRKLGKMSAEKKINNITNQGAIFSRTEDNVGVMLELNCETDFVSKDDLFISFGKEIILTALKEKIDDIKQLKNIFEEKRTSLIFKVGENINIRRFCFIKGENVLSYVHGVRIGVLVNANSDFNNNKILKNIAMHIAASKPQYLHPKDVSDSVFQREYQIQLELAKNLNKPSNILNKIIDGRMNKFVNSISLTSQSFIMDSNKTVKDILNEHNGHIKSFFRFELGEIVS